MKKYSILKILILSLLIALVSCIDHNTKYTRLTIKIEDFSVTEASLNKLMEVLTYRFNSIGVEDVSFKKLTTNSLQVEFPTLLNNYNFKPLIEKQGKLEFNLIPETNFTISVLHKVDEVLANLIAVNNQLLDSILTKSSGLDAFQQIKEKAKGERFKKDQPFLSIALLDPLGRSADTYVEADDRRKIGLILSQADIQKVIPNNVEFKFSAKTQTNAFGNEFYVMYLVNKNPELTGDVITDAVDGVDPKTSTPMVTLTMKSEAAKEWSRITGSNIYKRITIVLDGEVYTAPVVAGKITTGRSQIDGLTNSEEAENLAMILKSGMLPHQLKIIKVEYINLPTR